jgi:signal transduction histidine kinase
MNANPNKHSIRVLYLDDEENNLKAFKASFRRQYQVHTANNTEDAFSIVKLHAPHVILSDQRMPVTTGVEFFNAVRQVFPDPVRILITGFTDVNDIIDAINKGHIYRYITKPWSEVEIQMAIENAYDLYSTRRELEQRILDLEKTNDELNRFIYSISHDLRAPIASILGLINVSQLEVEDRLAQEYLEKISYSTNKLDILVNNIIDYYKNSKADGDITEIKIDELIEDVLDHLHEGGSSSDSVIISKEFRSDESFNGDYFRLRIALSHLVANAIRFKKPEQSRAKINISFDIQQDQVLISVKDCGLGILDKHLEQIFKMFFKSGEKNAGAGLGLYIVREALDKMKGEISVQSQPNQGAEFTIKLPKHP